MNSLDTLLAEIKKQANRYSPDGYTTAPIAITDFAKLLRIVECLMEGYDNIINGVDFPVEGNEAAIALRSNLIAQRCLEMAAKIAGDT